MSFQLSAISGLLPEPRDRPSISGTWRTEFRIRRPDRRSPVPASRLLNADRRGLPLKPLHIVSFHAIFGPSDIKKTGSDRHLRVAFNLERKEEE
jgi:hypothetical protein